LLSDLNRRDTDKEALLLRVRGRLFTFTVAIPEKRLELDLFSRLVLTYDAANEASFSLLTLIVITFAGSTLAIDSLSRLATDTATNNKQFQLVVNINAVARLTHVDLPLIRRPIKRMFNTRSTVRSSRTVGLLLQVQLLRFTLLAQPIDNVLHSNKAIRNTIKVIRFEHSSCSPLIGSSIRPDHLVQINRNFIVIRSQSNFR
jgi:hypothetical protein